MAAVVAVSIFATACSSSTPGSGQIVSTSNVAVTSSVTSPTPTVPSSTTASTSAAATSTPAGPTGASSSAGQATVTAGHYAGATGQGRPIALFVSADRASVQDVSITTIQLDCTPTATVFDLLSIRSLPIAADNSFRIETRQDGAYGGVPARFTYRFTGTVQPTDGSAAPTLTGTFRETISYHDTIAHECTTNDQTWSATFDDQPGQSTGAAPAPGTYTGSTAQGRPLTFSVASNPTRVQSIAIPTVGLVCLPGGAAAFDHFAIATATVDSAGTFSVTKPQNGVFNQATARFTVHFEGTFHGTDATGAQRAAGIFSETVTYADTAHHTCQSNVQSWTATRSA